MFCLCKVINAIITLSFAHGLWQNTAAYVHGASCSPHLPPPAPQHEPGPSWSQGRDLWERGRASLAWSSSPGLHWSAPATAPAERWTEFHDQSTSARCLYSSIISFTYLAAGQCPNTSALCNVSNLVQVVGQTVVETLHGFLLIGAVSVQTVELEADWPVEVLADGSCAAQRAGCCKRDGGPGAGAAGVHQRSTGKRGLTAHRETPHWHAGGHDGWLRRLERKQRAVHREWGN